MSSGRGRCSLVKVYLFLVLFYLALVVPSIGTVQHSPLGNLGVVAYALVACPLVYYLYMRLRVELPAKAATVNSERLGIAALVLIIMGCIIALPLLFPGQIGNTRSKSLDLCVGALLRGEYPYYASYSKSEPMTILPGGLLLAAPFVALGLTRYMSLFWLAIFYLVARRQFGRMIVFLLIVLWLCSPVLAYELAQGSDLLGDCLRVVILLLLLYRLDKMNGYLQFLVMVFAGLALSSRPVFLPMVPLLISVLAHRVGIWRAILHAATAAIIFALVTFPFYLYDPGGFTPLRVARFLNELNSVIPHYSLVVVTLTTALGLVLSLSVTSVYSVLARCAVVLALPVVLGIVVTSVLSGRFEVWAYSNFGLTFLFFAAIPLWYRLPKRWLSPLPDYAK